jgi:hypothetical protein
MQCSVRQRFGKPSVLQESADIQGFNTDMACRTYNRRRCFVMGIGTNAGDTKMESGYLGFEFPPIL